MTQQITKLKQFKDKKEKFSEIIDAKSFRSQKKTTLSNSIKAIRMYFEIVVENTLNGYEHILPKEFGIMYISKRHITNTSSRNTTSKHKYHPRHIFNYVLESEHLSKFGVVFRESAYLKNKLDKRLEDISVDYKLHHGIG